MPKKVLDMKITNRSVQYGNWPSKGAYNGHKHFICRQFDHNQENIDEIDRIHSLQYYPGLVKSIGIQIIDSRMYQIIQYIKGSKIDKETNVDQFPIVVNNIVVSKNFTFLQAFDWDYSDQKWSLTNYFKRKLQQCKEDCVEHIILKSQFESVIM